MNSKAVIELSIKDPHAFIKAVEHEKHSKRVKTSISTAGNVVRIKVEAKDATSLRATLNTYLRIAQTVEEVEGG